MPLADVGLAMDLPVRERLTALLTMSEDQWFDRKSVMIASKKLAESLVAMANADGGWLVIGLREGELEHTEAESGRLNALLQASVDHTDPPVRRAERFVACTRPDGSASDVLVLNVEPSDRVHKLNDGSCFLRVGDENRKLSPEQVVELGYDKGTTHFETSTVPLAEIEDLDVELLENYRDRVGGPDAQRTLEDRTLTKAGRVTVAGCLLFWSYPQKYFPNSMVRISRYSGTAREVGRRQNLIADHMVDGPLPRQAIAARALVQDLQPTRRALNSEGTFELIPTVPEDAWLEGLVNAIIHRSYSLEGDHIHVDIFDDRIEIFSPGRFPHVVDLTDPLSIRRYARNPRIVRVCFDLRICQELGEGIRRIFEEMRQAGLREPLYRQDSTGVTLTLSSAPMHLELDQRFPQGLREILTELRERDRASTAELVEVVGLSRPAVRARLDALRAVGLVGWYGKSAKDPRAYWYLEDGQGNPRR